MFCSIGRTFIQEWLVEAKRFSAAKDRAAKDMRKSLPCAACSECLTKPWPSHLSWAAQPLPRCFLGSENPAHGRSSWIARFNHPPSMSSLKNIHIIIYVYIYIHTHIYICNNNKHTCFEHGIFPSYPHNWLNLHFCWLIWMPKRPQEPSLSFVSPWTVRSCRNDSRRVTFFSQWWVNGWTNLENPLKDTQSIIIWYHMFSWNDICFKEDSIISSFHKFVSWIVPHHMVVQRCLSVLILWPGSESRALVITSLEEGCLGWKQLYRSCGVIFGICWKLWADHEENSHDPSTVFPFYLGANHHPLFLIHDSPGNPRDHWRLEHVEQKVLESGLVALQCRSTKQGVGEGSMTKLFELWGVT